MTQRTLRIRAADGFPLGATLHRGRGRDALVVAGATGVPRRFYDGFARHAAGREAGPSVLTFDYRGVGGSRPAGLRGFAATMRDWGELDLDAALRWALRELEPDRLLVLGHSVGGQLLGHAAAADEAAAAWLVGSQSGHWRHWPPAARAGIFALWHGLIPALSRALGYFPSPWFGLGEPLPAGVARQWARWGRHPDYLLRDRPEAAARYARLHLPLAAVSLRGDFFAPERAVRALLAMYPNAQARLVDGGDVGHFAWFRPGGERRWDEALDWLRDPRRPVGEAVR
jgi:predicted alpha/beta hydrolase